MKSSIYIFVFFCLLSPVFVAAHPGNTASDGKHYCRTNCASWGVPYGQRHGHGYSGYSAYSGYTSSSYTPSVPTYKSNNDCPSYAYAYSGSCYTLPSNARKNAFSGFSCNYGYESVDIGLSKQCLPDVENGYYIGSTLWCYAGYEKYYGSCVKKESTNYTDYSDFFGGSNNSSGDTLSSDDPYAGEEFTYYYRFDESDNEIDRRKISSKCKIDKSETADAPYFRNDNQCFYCTPGYISNRQGDKCLAMTDVCTDILGPNSEVISDGKCKCQNGYKKSGGKCISKSTASNNVSETDLPQFTIDELLEQIEKLQGQLLEVQS